MLSRAELEVIHWVKTDIFDRLNRLSKIARIAGRKVVARNSFIIGLILLSVQLFAQVSFESQEELEKAANAYFEAKEYSKAKPLFSQLLSKDAMNPNYNYRFGTCIMFTEADPLKPLPYIEGGASTKGVNPEAHYFLGKNYQFNYRFEDAILSYEKGKSAGFSAIGIDLNRSIEECRNGRLLYNSAIDFKPAQDKEVLASEFYRPYDFRKLKGKVIPMPPTFKTKYDEKNLTGTVIYTPTSSEVLIYASYGEDGANAKDLYRVNRLPSGEWALPQRLPATINTKYDEDYAFYDEQSQTLFFASKGHNTMGGYDIFTSKYNSDANTWSTPINLQYPINSPFDDFLYVSDDEGKVAFFTTARQTEEGKLRVYKTLLYDPSQVELTMVEGTYEDLTDSVFNYMSATVIDPRTNEVIGKYRSNKETGKYVLILPPQNDYSINVGPREAEGFKFDLDIPAQTSVEALKQSIAYNASDGQGTLQLTNYFDATGKQDTVKFSQSLSAKDLEAKMVQMPDPALALAARNKANSDQEAKLKAETLAAEKAKAEEIIKSLAAENAKSELAAKEMALAEEKAKVEEQKLKAEAELAAEKAKAESVAKEQALALEKAKAEEQKLKDAAELAAQKAKAESVAKDQALALEKAKAEEQKLKAEAELAVEQAKAESVAKEQSLALEKAKAEEQKLKAEAELAVEKAKVESANKDQALAEEKAKAEEQKLIAEAEQLAAEFLVDEPVASKEDESRQKMAMEDSLTQQAIMEEKNKQEKLEWLEQQAVAKKQQLLAQAQQDSVEMVRIQTEKVQENDLAVQKAKQDSLANEELKFALAQAERKRLDEIELEVQAAKQKAMRDSLPSFTGNKEETVEVKSDSEVAAVERVTEDQNELANAGLKAKLEEVEKSPLSNDAVAMVKKDSLDTVTASDSELFLATIAKLEAQKSEQEKLIEQENRELAQAKQAAKADLQKEVTPASDDMSEALETTGGGSILYDQENQVIETVSVENADRPVAALKSDADPTDYLAELNRVEKEMKQEAAARPDKTYELRPLAPVNEPAPADIGVDLVLEKNIEKDRLALAEHQKIAVEKERLMNEQMLRDKQALGRNDENNRDEIEAIENEARLALEEQKSVVEKQTQEVEVDAIEPVIKEPKVPVVQEPTEVALVQELDQEFENLLKSIEDPKPESAVVAAVSETESVKVEMVSVSEPANTNTIDSTPEPVVVVMPVEKESVEQREVAVELVEAPKQATAEVEVKIVSEDKSENLLAAVEEEFAKLNMQTTDVPTPSDKSEESVEQVVNVEFQTALISNEKEPQPSIIAPSAREDGVGQIHLIKAAVRDPLATKPSFDKVNDDQVRRMIKRMRAEDIGRMAVLKNMKNQWVDAGRSTEALSKIKGKLRNQDVLENSSVVSREETIRKPFDRNDLRERKDVYYKLKFKIVATAVSETIQEAMLPELAVFFNMPEVELSSDHFTTLADATSGFFEFRNRGFEEVRIVPFLNGKPVMLSDVQDIPFVD